MLKKEMIQDKLFEMRDDKYWEFNKNLIPNIDSETIIGIRIPILRKYAGELFKTGGHHEFLNSLPHKYHEENNLHGFLIEKEKDYEKTITELERFFPYIDNWATCDVISPPVFKKHRKELIEKIKEWIDSDQTYKKRFAIKMLMVHFLGEDFKKEYLELVSGIRTDEYYLNMMIAWYFATALAKKYDETIEIIHNKSLDKWTHNKTIQKAIESYRIENNIKEYLRGLKITKEK